MSAPRWSELAITLPAGKNGHGGRREENDAGKPRRPAFLRGAEESEDVADNRHKREEEANDGGRPSAPAECLLNPFADEIDLQQTKRDPRDGDQTAQPSAAAHLHLKAAHVFAGASAVECVRRDGRFFAQVGERALGGLAQFVIADSALFAGFKHIGFKSFDCRLHRGDRARHGAAARAPAIDKTAHERLSGETSIEVSLYERTPITRRHGAVQLPFSLAEKGSGDEGRSNDQAPERLNARHPAASRRPSPQGRG